MTFTSINIATGSSSFSACDVKRAHRLGRRHRTARDTSVGYLDDGMPPGLAGSAAINA